jgi:hypothetical protein
MQLLIDLMSGIRPSGIDGLDEIENRFGKTSALVL